MAYLATFFWGWLLLASSLLLDLGMGWIAVVHRSQASRSSRDGFRCWPSRWSRLRCASCQAVSASGDLGLVFGLRLCGCAVGSWLRDWVVSRSVASDFFGVLHRQIRPVSALCGQRRSKLRTRTDAP